MPSARLATGPRPPELLSDRERLRRAVATAAREWQRTVDALESPILVLESDGRIRRLNRTAVELLERDFPAVLGRRLEELETGEPWATAAAAAAESRSTHEAAMVQCRDGRGRTWEVASRVSWDGDAPWTVLTLRDLTERVALEQSVRRNEVLSALGTVVAGVVHEARNPLFGISAALDAFVARIGDDPALTPFVDVLRGEVARLGDLVDGLFEYGKAPTRELEPGRIEAVVAEAVEACTSLGRSREVGLVVRCPEALPQVLLNRRRLVYVVSNLVRNAVQHSPAGAMVEIAVEPDGEAPGAGLVCRVRDRGSGIAAEDLPRLFEPFFSRRRGGTGLGLAVAQRIVEEHGGRIRARNRPGGGAEVTFWLPSLAPDRGTGEAVLCGARSGGGA